MADCDALTGLWTRGTLDVELPVSLSHAATDKRPLSVVMIDLDHFKRINDTHGHQRGDAVLSAVGACIDSVAAGKGKIYRYGGEEILMLLPNHTLEEAVAVAERVRRQIESAPIAGVNITASLGVSTYPDHATDAAQLIRCADVALYDAKNKGRNLVRIYGEPEPPKEKTRSPERKLPTPGSLTEHQKSELRRQYFTKRAIYCPEDGARLQVSEVNDLNLNTTTPPLRVWCKLCGLMEKL
jgi:diguanylate cyclase (GGDEF)-like protein